MSGITDKRWRDDLQSALDGIHALQAVYPGDVALLSAERQLTYLVALADGVEKDDGALEDISLGYLAMIQLTDVLTPELSELLCELSDRVRRYLRQLGRKLKIDQSGKGKPGENRGQGKRRDKPAWSCE